MKTVVCPLCRGVAFAPKSLDQKDNFKTQMLRPSCLKILNKPAVATFLRNFPEDKLYFNVI